LDWYLTRASPSNGHFHRSPQCPGFPPSGMGTWWSRLSPLLHLPPTSPFFSVLPLVQMFLPLLHVCVILTPFPLFSIFFLPLGFLLLDYPQSFLTGPGLLPLVPQTHFGMFYSHLIKHLCLVTKVPLLSFFPLFPPSDSLGMAYILSLSFLPSHNWKNCATQWLVHLPRLSFFDPLSNFPILSPLARFQVGLSQYPFFLAL